MAHQIVEINCPGCGARVSTGQKECEWCHKPISISIFNSVYSFYAYIEKGNVEDAVSAFAAFREKC